MKRPDGSNAETLTRTQLMHEWVHFLQDSGWDIADGSRGKPSFPADRDAVIAMQAMLQKLADGAAAAYGTHPLGELVYRQQVAQGLQQEYGIGFDPESVAFTPGGQFGLTLSFQMIHEHAPDGIILAPCPWYLNHEELARMTMLNPHRGVPSLWPVSLSAENGYRLNGKLLAAEIARMKAEGQRIAGFLFCNPANPTGVVTRKEEWQEVAELLRLEDVPIMLDEAFTELVFDERYEVSLLHAAPDLLERTFLFRSGTKALGLPGERLAVMTVPPAFRERMIFLQSRWLGNTPLSAQAGMAAAMQHMTTAKKQTLSRYYQANCRAMEEVLAPCGIMQTLPAPEGGFYRLANLSSLIGKPIPQAAKDALGHKRDIIADDNDIAFSLVFGLGQADKTGVAVMPASCFGLEAEQGVVRLSFSPAREEALQIAGRVAQALTQ